MKSEIEKFTKLIMKKGKRETMDGTELLNEESIRNMKLLVFGDIGNLHHQLKETKEKLRKEYLRSRKPLESKLSNRKITKEINTGANLLVRHFRLSLKWTRQEHR